MEESPMCSVRFTISAAYRKEVERHVKTAQHLGHLHQVKSLLTILAVVDGQSFAQVALVVREHEKTGAAWIRECCCYGLQGAPRGVLLLWTPGRATDKAHWPPAATDPNAESSTHSLDCGRASQGRFQRRLLALAHDSASPNFS
jgi:hypothetical protein